MTTKRIDAVAEARKHIEGAHEQQVRDGEYGHSVRDNAILAQAEATLALVEQQRLANLIALWMGPDYAVEALEASGEISYDRVRDAIREGLGL